MSAPRQVKITYQTVTPESAEHGDFAETGWLDGCWKYDTPDGIDFDCMDPDKWDREEGITAIDKTVEFLRDAGAVHPSDSGGGSGTWYSTESELDYRTGESETRSYHLGGFTPEEEQAIFDHITTRQDSNQ